jgi:hypothetical protein
MIGISVGRTNHLNPGLRWRWDIPGTGFFGYAMTMRVATRDANRQLQDYLNMIGGQPA